MYSDSYAGRKGLVWLRSLIAVHQPRTFPTTSQQITDLPLMLEKGTIMSGTSPKQLEANRSNAQRSTGPRTSTDGVAAISDRGSLTVVLKPFGVPEEMPMEKLAVAHRRRYHILPSSNGYPTALLWVQLIHAPAFPDRRSPDKIVCCQRPIELPLDRAMSSLQEHRCLPHSNPSETLPIDEN